MGYILAFRAAGGRRAGRSSGGGGHSHTGPWCSYPQGYASASGYPQGFSRGLIARERGGIVDA